MADAKINLGIGVAGGFAAAIGEVVVESLLTVAHQPRLSVSVRWSGLLFSAVLVWNVSRNILMNNTVATTVAMEQADQLLKLYYDSNPSDRSYGRT